MQWWRVQRRFAVMALVLALINTVALTRLWKMADDPAAATRGAPVGVAAALPAAAAWSTTWATAPAAAESGAPNGHAGYTVRDVVHTTIGGDRVRVRLSNRYGTAAVRFGHVTVARSARPGGRWNSSVADPGDGSAAPGTMRDLRFAGADQVTVEAGAEMLSDPVDLSVPADADLLVSMWTPLASGTVTFHPVARQVSYYTPGPDDRAAAQDGSAFPEQTRSWVYLGAVEVAGGPGTLVALGDSITDGAGASLGLNRRWPDHLAARLASSTRPHYGVANAGISGNRVLLDSGTPQNYLDYTAGPSARSRLQGDVLDRAGVRTVIIAEGINDILKEPNQRDPARIVAGLRELAGRSRANGLRVIVATLTPWEGWRSWTLELETVRVAVNDWIRAGGDGVFDGVADFDRVLRDPAAPQKLRTVYDSGDHLHPNDAGMVALAYTVPIDLL
ncbi:SGNH/GDSL hydrolase family protein [Micromonosporaceae bacterium Da 78-11]